ncbi:hypothetical protein [Pelagicoccus sp. SDUM812002]|uniref:hypothetical protein n=1 Tax=Pelagicoccus sp. SDUM812002 TaxID=3041266 RepID=UPI00280C4E43|nr:hypothetical protein [Pelagicoccus sp. SDUM812002]MDQ8186534.1 hypothetical protein [Pelagicoccus sp. SDUM812002]
MIRRIDINAWRRLGIVAVALLVLGLGHFSRIEHIDYVSELGGGSAIEIDRQSSTGYEEGRRKLIVPQRNVRTYQWIMQGQQMIDEGTFDLKRVNYDNAPDGRPVLTPSLYRWWLIGLAWLISIFTGVPLGVSVERAALYADPILQVLAIVFASVLLRRLSWRSTLLFAAGAIALFPLGASFFPGQADDTALGIIFSFFAVLPLLIPLVESCNRDEIVASKRMAIIAGISGGFSLWLSPSGGGVLILALAFAGGLKWALGHVRKKQDKSAIKGLPDVAWRAWAWSGCISVLTIWLLENGIRVLDSSSWGMGLVNPVYAVVWLCVGELLVFLRGVSPSSGRRKVIQAGTLVLLSTAGLILIMTSETDWAVNQVGLDLSRASLPEDSGSTIKFLAEGGANPLVIVTLCIPILIGVFAIVYLSSTRRPVAEQGIVLLGLVPIVVALTLAVFAMGWWAHFQILALGLATVAVSIKKIQGWYRTANVGVVVCSLVVGSSLVFKDQFSDSGDAVSEVELISLVERDLANWLSLRQNPERPVILTSPNTAAALAYFGNLKVLSTPYPENIEGFSAAVRLCAAATADEAQAIADGRSVDFIIDPSWDPYLEQYSIIGSNEIDQSFALLLKQWLPPLWLRPMRYDIPHVDGFENERVVIFRTIENQMQEDALARLTEYFIDSRSAENAMKVHAALAMGFPDRLVTHLTRAELALALGDKGKLNEAVSALRGTIQRGNVDYLDWDLRVNLALVLIGANEIEEAKKQLEICVQEATDEKLRQLSDGALESFRKILDALNWKLPSEDLDRYLAEMVR